ncbi:hypothetical protein Nepgr_029210 [Nepenthes gracilis]|uniref:Pentatricopeptide repeat-containing protein n=1 Tax=Nepenthes gracilis TaxID=150966 RepID=A0AAD3TDJ5_NEPGR|nr:hypothetical protein Nepgr_029210 [Nepenthes gracilis]
MDSTFLRYRLHHPVSEASVIGRSVCNKITLEMKLMNDSKVNLKAQSKLMVHNRKPPKYVHYPHRRKLRSDVVVYEITRRQSELIGGSQMDSVHGGPEPVGDGPLIDDANDLVIKEDEEHAVWDADELEAITSLFQWRIPQKPGKLNRERPLPLPLPYKFRPVGLPTVKTHVKITSLPPLSSRSMLSKQICKDPVFLINIAREIRSLPTEENVSLVLNKHSRFLQKGSLSLTIRELGHMGLPERALQTFCWVQKQPRLFPDDRILASTVEILARTHKLRFPVNLEKLIDLATGSVLEAMTRGLIRGGSLNLAWGLLMAARYGKRMLDPSIYAKLILEFGKNPDKHNFIVTLLEELGERADLNLNQQDCTAIMKICVRLGKFELVESLFNWYKQSGHTPSVVMYTTMIHSRYTEKKYREALALVWEMEDSNYLFDLPAYRVAIKLFIALNDLRRTVRYFSKLKEAGFSPTYDLYRGLINIYLVYGRLGKCKEVCTELELSGFTLDAQLRAQLLHVERNIISGRV